MQKWSERNAIVVENRLFLKKQSLPENFYSFCDIIHDIGPGLANCPQSIVRFIEFIF